MAPGRTNKSKREKINPYREQCRSLIAKHPKLHWSHKVILMRLTDYVNRNCYEAFVGEKTLANDCGVNARSIRRAKKSAIELGILECKTKGNQYVGACHYVFKMPTTNAEDDECPVQTKSAEDTLDSARDTSESAEDASESAGDVGCPPINPESRTSESRTSEAHTPQTSVCGETVNGYQVATKSPSTDISHFQDDSPPLAGSYSPSQDDSPAFSHSLKEAPAVAKESLDQSQAEASAVYFERLGDAYVRQESIEAARETFYYLIEDEGINPEEIIDGAKRHAVAMTKRETKPKYIPLLNKWLGLKKWKDKYPDTDPAVVDQASPIAEAILEDMRQEADQKRQRQEAIQERIRQERRDFGLPEQQQEAA